MAERIAILGGEPYAEWIERDGTAQRMFKTYCDKWPDGDTQCVAMGDEFSVRFHDGEMRRVDSAADFEDESEWCSSCGAPIDPENSDDCDGCYCPQHRGAEAFTDYKEPSYVYPYASFGDNQFTFGVEIELESELSDDFVETVTNSELIAGWGKDASLGQNGVELQSNILDMSKLPALKRIVEGIPEYGNNAGGHIHVARTDNQCASRWWWALHGLDESQCERLNMRHIDDDYWCTLEHGEWTGKHTAINDEHPDTIELRTFGCWYAGSADKLIPAVKWIRAMWRFFEKYPIGAIGANSIEQYASCMADNVTDTPTRTLAERLTAAHRVAAERKAAEELARQARAIETRRRVVNNITVSRRARASHGDTRPARREWNNHQIHRARRRETIDGHLSNTTYPYVLPSRNLRPLHVYLRMATVIVEKGETFRSLDHFRIYHAVSEMAIWEGCEYCGRHGDAQRVIENILRSRVARASHGKPTNESLKRTALRWYKRAGRPELSERYAQIRKNIAAARKNANQPSWAGTSNK